jgi:protein-tyrosine phosphatase
MMKVLFLCTGNFYRSRLAEELLRGYSEIGGVDLVSDSAGLGPIPNPINIGPIRAEVIDYLAGYGMRPTGADRVPRKCGIEDIESSDVVIGMNEIEHRQMIEEQFPGIAPKRIRYWHVPDMEEDPNLTGPDLMDRNVKDLLGEISGTNHRNMVESEVSRGENESDRRVC